MKKLFPIIAFFLCCFGFSFTSYASYLPPTLPQTQVVPDFLQNIAQYQIVNDTNSYLPKTDLNAVNQLVNGRSIADSFQYVYLDNSSLNADFGNIYTVDGVEVNQNDTYTVYGTSDLGPFMCICAKGTGEILYQGSSDSLHSTLVGGQGLKESFPEFIVRELSGGGLALERFENVHNAVNEARLDSMIIYGNSLTASDKDFLADYRFYFRLQTNYGWSVYVPNACSDDTLVAPNSSNIYSLHGSYSNNSMFLDPIIYTNDPSTVYYSGSGAWVGLKQESVYVYGKVFNYCSSYRNAFDPLGAGFTVDMELPSYSQYLQYKNLSEDAFYVAPVDNVDNAPVDNVYNYTYVTNNPPVSNRYVNNNYNYEGDTNYNNYPIYYNFEYPTYPTTNDYVTNIYNYYNSPQQGDSIGNISDPVIPENIPILSNLEKRFPFSIPFDLYKLATGLSVPRETPYIDTVIVIPGINYSWHIDYDLHSFDDVADLFRLLQLILFIVGLAIFSYDHFFGS